MIGEQPAAPPAAQRPPSRARRGWLTAAALLLVLLFAGLGTWQVVRLQWKLALIARVDARVHAPPSAPPGAEHWATVNVADDEYRHVRVRGIFLYDLTTPVQAVSRFGSGFWLMTPLCQADGHIVMINRGFIPGALGANAGYPARRADADRCSRAGTPVTISGLLRLSEPKGGFLRANDPDHHRWYSRDVPAIATARGLSGVAPYFIDADAGQGAWLSAPDEAAQAPVGGLTVISFPNNHLVYALTWYALAAMVAGAWLWIVRRGPGRERNDDSFA